MSIKVLGELVGFGFLVCLSNFCSACESALTCLGRTGRESIKDRDLGKWDEEPYRYLVTVMVGNVLSIIGAALMAQAVAFRYFSFINIPNAFLLACLTSFFATAFSVFYVGEVLARTLGKKYALRIAPKAIKALDLLYYSILWLPTRLVLVLTGKMFQIAGIPGQPAQIIRTEEELRNLLHTGSQDTELEQEQSEMIHSIFEFGETVAREVMVPRTDIDCVSEDATLQELLHCVTDCGHSRIPIYREKTDNIVGILYAKDLLRYWQIRQDAQQQDSQVQNDPFRIEQFMRPPHFVPENKSLRDLLKDFRSKRMHLAIVVDEYGGTAGLITIEDVLEEIVGEIQDEYDSEEELYSIQEDGSILIDAKMSAYEITEQLGIHLTGEDFETLGGFLFSVIGDVPTVGREVLHDDLRITVVEADERHVIKARIQRLTKPTPSTESEGTPQ